MKNKSSEDLMIGEFLVSHEIITREQLTDALDMQKDNPERLLGEILVTMGLVTKDELILALEMFLMTTDAGPGIVTEWLDQDEIDMLIDRIQNSTDGKK